MKTLDNLLWQVASMGVDLPGNVSCLQLNSSGSLLALALDSGNIPILDTKELWRRRCLCKSVLVDFVCAWNQRQFEGLEQLACLCLQ